MAGRCLVGLGAAVTLTLAITLLLRAEPAPARDLIVASASSAPPCELSGAEACEAPEAPEAAPAPHASWGRPLLLEFTSDYCPACAKMRPLLSDIARACPAAADAVVVADVDDPKAQSIAERYRVQLLPTFVRIDAEGNELERFVGTQSRERLAIALNAVSGGACAAL